MSEAKENNVTSLGDEEKKDGAVLQSPPDDPAWCLSLDIHILGVSCPVLPLHPGTEPYVPLCLDRPLIRFSEVKNP